MFPRGETTVGYRLGKDVVTDEFEAWKPIDEQMGFDERIRLLYVACTRAKDHLVVSLHRADRKNPPKPPARSNAELLVEGMGPTYLEQLPEVGGVAVPRQADPVAAPTPPPPFGEWLAERDRAIAIAAHPGAVAATALTDEGAPDLGHEPAPASIAADTEPPAGSTPGIPPTAPSLFDVLDDDGDPGPSEPTDLDPADHVVPADPGLQKRPRDLDLPPWLKGRYGTAEGLTGAVAAQCQAEAIPERTDDVRTLVDAALGSAVVRAAAEAPHWREIYACAPVGDRLLEGYIDLLYRSADGLVVVDHKTAATSDPDELDRRVHGYRLQGAAYALVVAATTGEPVTSVVFLFLTPDGPVERQLPDLATAVTEVEALVRAGAELVTT